MIKIVKKTVICFVLAICVSFVGILPLSGKVSAQSAPVLSAVSAVLINARTGTIIYGKNYNEPLAMASTTKIMTALLTIEAGDLDTRFTADEYAIRVEGTSMGLKEGDIVTRRALLYGMLLPSGNDAANAAAVNVGGSMSDFVKMMNEKAEELGLSNTHFANPSGLDADGHYTTALDLALLTMYALENPVFAEICACSEAKVEFGNPPYLRTLSNSNKMLWQYDGCIGVKTGFTDNARRCLVSAAQRNGVTLICVTLNAPDDWNDHAKLLDHGFEQVRSTEIVLPQAAYVPVVGGYEQNVRLQFAEKIKLPLSKSEAEKIEIVVYAEPFLYAGFEAGEKAGRAEIYLDGKLAASADLITEKGAEEKPQELDFFEKIVLFLRRFFNW